MGAASAENPEGPANFSRAGSLARGSSVISKVENHTPTTIDEAIAYAVSHDTEFPEADIHGQYQSNFKHTHIPKGRETDYLLRNE